MEPITITTTTTGVDEKKVVEGNPATITNSWQSFYTYVSVATLAILALFLSSETISQLLRGNISSRWANYTDEILLAGFVFFLVFAVSISRRLFLSHIWIGLICFSLLGWVTTIWNGVPWNVALLGYFLTVKPLILLIVYQSLPFNRHSAVSFLKWLDVFFMVIVVTAVSYTFVLELVADINPLPGVVPGEYRLGLPPSRSFFVHPSHFSSIMTIISFYACANFLLTRSKRYIVVFCLSLICVLLTFRMKAIFLLPVGVVIIFALINTYNLRVKMRTVVVGSMLTTVCLVTILLFAVLFNNILVFRLTQDTQNIRTLLMRHAVVINEETYGFGAGFGMFGSAVSADYRYSPLYYRFGYYQLRGANPENTAFITDQWWAWYLGEAGVWGTAVFIITLVWVGFQLVKIANYWREHYAPLAAFGYAAIGSLLFGVMAGFAGVYLSAPPTGYIITALAGLTFALDRGLKQKPFAGVAQSGQPGIFAKQVIGEDI